jgi:hypothetical protein
VILFLLEDTGYVSSVGHLDLSIFKFSGADLPHFLLGEPIRDWKSKSQRGRSREEEANGSSCPRRLVDFGDWKFSREDFSRY